MTYYAVHLPESLMLQDEDLLTVLVATVQYWPIWPPWQYGALPPTMRTLQTGGVEFAALFLSHMVSSGSPCIVAKALLWLSLCIQQAPKTLQLSSRQSAGVGRHGGETLHGIEARLIQQKLYLNMGWPRQAWLSVRRAADGALLLRLHRALDQKGGGGGEEDRKVAIWTEICHLDTTFALILGLPSTVPPSAGQRDHDDGNRGRSSPLRTLQLRLYDLARVRGDEEPEPAAELSRHCADRPRARGVPGPDARWLDGTSRRRRTSRSRSCNAQQVTKVHYFLIAKPLHLHFMLGADAGSGSSCVSAVAASRRLVSAYLGLKACGNGLFLTCETLEFQAFGAGVTLVIRLLSTGSPARRPRCWGLLAQAARGAYAGPDRYDVVLPYFGKITIALSRGWKAADPEAWNKGSPQQQQQQQQPAPPPFGTVEFSANAFDVVHFSGSLEGELGGDWSSMADVDIGFDWTQTFTFGNNSNNNKTTSAT
ncbi:hypothetical protein LY76DRAFT_659179 [Colletotrichum caudatum]|nr:hypothetical protein LY76DRAFT_659179 [Colletotrichum caudatum]